MDKLDHEPSPIFDRGASPLYDDKGKLTPEKGFKDKVSSLLARVVLWFKALDTSKAEGLRASHVIKLLDAEDRLAMHEKLQGIVPHQEKAVEQTLPKWRQQFSEEVVNLVPGLQDKEYYQTSILEMTNLMHNLVDHSKMAENLNQLWSKHNGVPPEEGPFYNQNAKVTDFKQNTAQDFENFKQALRKLRIDVQQYNSSKAAVLANDARALIESCERLMANPAFKEYGWKTDLSVYLADDKIHKAGNDLILGKLINKTFWADTPRATFCIQAEGSNKHVDIRNSDTSKNQEEKAKEFLEAVVKLRPDDPNVAMDAMKCCCQTLLMGANELKIMQELNQQFGRKDMTVGSAAELGSIPKIYFKVSKNPETQDLVFVGETILKAQAINDPDDKKYQGYIIMRVTVDRATGHQFMERSDLVQFVPAIDPSVAKTNLHKLNRQAVEVRPDVAEYNPAEAAQISGKERAEASIAEHAQKLKRAKSAVENLEQRIAARKKASRDALRIPARKEAPRHALIDEIFSSGWIDKATKENLTNEYKNYYSNALKGLLRISSALADSPPDAKKVCDAINAFNLILPGENGYVDHFLKDRAALDQFSLAMKSDLKKLEERFSAIEKNWKGEGMAKQITTNVSMLFNTLRSTLLDQALDQSGWQPVSLGVFLSSEKQTLVDDPNRPKIESEKIVNTFKKDITRDDFYVEQTKVDDSGQPIQGFVHLERESDVSEMDRIKTFKNAVIELATSKYLASDETRQKLLLDAEAASAQSIINKLLQPKMERNSLGIKALLETFKDTVIAGEYSRHIVKKGEKDLLFITEQVYRLWSIEPRMVDGQLVSPRNTIEGTLGYMVARVVADQATGKISYEWSEVIDFEPQLAPGIETTDLKNLQPKPKQEPQAEI